MLMVSTPGPSPLHLSKMTHKQAKQATWKQILGYTQLGYIFFCGFDGFACVSHLTTLLPDRDILTNA
jgi:hypothetical protein